MIGLAEFPRFRRVFGYRLHAQVLDYTDRCNRTPEHGLNWVLARAMRLSFVRVPGTIVVTRVGL